MTMIKMSKKDKIELILTIILALIFIVLLFAFTHRIQGRSYMPKHISSGMFSAAEHFRYDPKRDYGTSLILDKTFGGRAAVERDPFSFSSSEQTNAMVASDLFLKGIVWNPDNPYAIINDRLLRAGDTIGGFKVEKVLQDSVVLENGASRLELKASQ